MLAAVPAGLRAAPSRAERSDKERNGICAPRPAVPRQALPLPAAEPGHLRSARHVHGGLGHHPGVPRSARAPSPCPAPERFAPRHRARTRGQEKRPDSSGDSPAARGPRWGCCGASPTPGAGNPGVPRSAGALPGSLPGAVPGPVVPGCAGSRPAAPPTRAGTRRTRRPRPWRRWRRRRPARPGPRRRAALATPPSGHAPGRERGGASLGPGFSCGCL